MRVNEIGVEMEERGTFYRSPPPARGAGKKTESQTAEAERGN